MKEDSVNDYGDDYGLRSAFALWAAARQGREAPNRPPLLSPVIVNRNERQMEET